VHLRFAVRVTAGIALAAMAVAGCARAPQPGDPNVRGIAYVRVDDALKKHPLYPQLAQLQDAIDALGMGSVEMAGAPHSQADIAKDTIELNRELVAAQNHANAILQQKQQGYQRREQAAIAAALASAGAGTNGSPPLAQMRTTGAQQAQSVAQQANADFGAYQRGVIAQDNAAVRAMAQQLNARADQSFRLRATELGEQESQLNLQLSQQDAAKKLALQMKLNGLALSDAERKADTDELAAINARESAVMNVRHSRDQQQLSAYRKQLQRQTAAQIAAEAAKIHAQTQAKLQSRRNEVSQQVASQLQDLQPQAIPSNLPAATQAKLAQIDRTFKAQFRADAEKTIAQYQQTKSALDARYAQLQGADGSAGTAANAQVASLERQRDDLYNRMVAQIESDAAAIAKQRGLTVALKDVDAAAGGIDLTDDVEKDIESQHQ
jgi:hypothetical protein